MQLMLSEENPDIQNAYKLIKTRRLKGRDINGPVTLFMKQYHKQEKEQIKIKLVECWESIEDVELHSLKIDEREASEIERKVLKKELGHCLGP